MSEHDEGWNEAERRAFGALATELPPPAAAEERLVEELRRRGLVAGSRRLAAKRRLLAAAAALLLLAAGFAAGRAASIRGGAAPAAPRFALFLLRGAEDVPLSDADETVRVAEYKSWARGLARTGRFVSGERLEERGVVLASADEPPAAPILSGDEVRGYFVISAASLDDAISAARGCPHLKHGGRILVRPIAKT